MSDVKRNKFSVKVNATGTTKIKMGTETITEHKENESSPSWMDLDISSLVFEIQKLRKDSSINIDSETESGGVRG
jgi:hypothetical protein